MNAPARSNPEATAVTKVIFGSAQQAAQAGPVRLGHSEVGGEKQLAGLIESLALRD
jgi:hypothetical protein